MQTVATDTSFAGKGVTGILHRYDELKGQRQLKEPIWRDIEKYCIPGVVPYATKGYKESVKPDVYDGTAFKASKLLISGLYTTLTNPFARWFELDNNGTVAERQKVYDVSEQLRDLFFHSNFYTSLDLAYNDLVHYGLFCLYEEKAKSNVGFNFKVINPINFVFDENQWGQVNQVMIEFELTAAEAVNTFRDVSEKIAKASVSEPYKRFKFLQVVGERAFTIIGKRIRKKKEKPFYSYFIELDAKKLVAEDGYDTFPFFVIRWDKKTNDLYGSSPSMVALPDVKSLNSMRKSFIINDEKITNPPLSLPYEGYLGDIDLRPGGLNYRLTNDPNDRIEPIVTSGNLNANADIINDTIASIRGSYFNDLFMINKDTTMTATEVIQRVQEKMLVLGAVVGRLIHNFLTPLINRSIAIMIDEGIVTDIPDYDIKYLSSLAQAQQSSQYSSMVVLLNSVLQVAQFNPSVVDNINWDSYVNKVAKIYAVPPDLLNDEKVVEAIRQQRQQMQAIQTQLALKEQAGKADKQAAQAQLAANKAQGLV